MSLRGAKDALLFGVQGQALGRTSENKRRALPSSGVNSSCRTSRKRNRGGESGSERRPSKGNCGKGLVSSQGAPEGLAWVHFVPCPALNASGRSKQNGRDPGFREIYILVGRQTVNKTKQTNKTIHIKKMSRGWCGSVDREPPCKPQGRRFHSPHQGTRLGGGAGSQSGAH